MALIGEKEQAQLREMFAKLQGTVKIVFFTQEHECQFCKETHQLVEELAALSDQITLEVYDFQADQEQVTRYGVDKIPAIALIGAKDYGVRFYGIPSGYEFGALVQDIVDVANGTTELNAKTKAALSELQEPVHFQVFSTPT